MRVLVRSWFLFGCVLLGSVLLCIGPAFAQNPSSNSLLNGSYAFLIRGYDANDLDVAMAGSLQADGKGNITSGVFDANGINCCQKSGAGGAKLGIVVTGTYAIVSNYRGTITLNWANGGTATFVIAVGAIVNGVATKASIDKEPIGLGFGLAGARASGTFELQDPTAFSTSAFSGRYVIAMRGKSGCVAGFTTFCEAFASVIGSFSAGSGTFANTMADFVFGGVKTDKASFTGSYTVAANGRGTASLTGIGAAAINLVVYAVSTDRWFALSSDSTGAIWTGHILRQSGPFSASSCNGSYVATVSIQDLGGIDSQLFLSHCDGAGTINVVSYYENDTGNLSAVDDASMFPPITYTVSDANAGRFVLAGQIIQQPTSGYLVGPNEFFFTSAAQNANLVHAERQTGGPFTNASLNGAYYLGTEPFPAQLVGNASLTSGVLAADGAGNISSTLDRIPVPSLAGDLALDSGQSGSVGYSVDAKGRITLSDGSAVGLIVSPSKAVFLDMNPAHPNPTLQTAAAVGATAQVTPQSDWWWDPKLNGTGFFVEYGGKSAGGMFVAGFLYDSSGNNTWLVSTGQMSGSTYTSTWLKATGGQTLLGPYKAPGLTAAGNLSITFTDSSHAVMTRPDGTLINLVRFSFTASATPAAPVAGAPQSGWWWGGSALSGTGYGIEIQGTSVFIVAYVYDDAGNPVWYLATGSLTTPTSYAGAWDVYAGGPQLISSEGTYSAHKVSTASPMTLTFSDATHGTMTMGSVTIPIARFQEF